MIRVKTPVVFSCLFCAMASEPLQNLTEQSARVGTWLLSVATDPRPEEYTWNEGTGKGHGKKLGAEIKESIAIQYRSGNVRKA